MCMDAPLGDILVLVLCFLCVHQMVGQGYANEMEKMVLSCREGTGNKAMKCPALPLVLGISKPCAWGVPLWIGRKSENGRLCWLTESQCR